MAPNVKRGRIATAGYVQSLAIARMVCLLHHSLARAKHKRMKMVGHLVQICSLVETVARCIVRHAATRSAEDCLQIAGGVAQPELHKASAAPIRSSICTPRVVVVVAMPIFVRTLAAAGACAVIGFSKSAVPCRVSASKVRICGPLSQSRARVLRPGLAADACQDAHSQWGQYWSESWTWATPRGHWTRRRTYRLLQVPL